MRELDLQNETGCEPSRGPRVVLNVARRGLRRLLRPTFARLAEVFDHILTRLDRSEAILDAASKTSEAVEARVDGAEGRLDSAEWNASVLHKKTDGLSAHLAGLNDEHLALREDVRRLADDRTRTDAALSALPDLTDGLSALQKRTDGLTAHLAALNRDHLAHVAELRTLRASTSRVDGAESRLDAAEKRLDSAEWHGSVLHQRTEGLTAHLASLDAEHRGLAADVGKRSIQLTSLFQTVGNIGRRQDELDEKIDAVHALHWDHVALAHRLSILEDLLSGGPAPGSAEARPLIPFPGVDDESRPEAV